MKRFFCLLLTVLLVISATCALANCSDSIPDFTADFGISEYYEFLKEQNGGLFRNWSPEAKARFYASIPSLCAMEKERLQTYHSDWSPDFSFLSGIAAQTYILPDETMLDQASATESATEWALSHQLFTSEELSHCTISASCIQQTDDCEWSIAFYDSSVLVADVHLNAVTGEFPDLDCVQAKQKILDFSHATNTPAEIQLDDLFTGAGYDYSRHTWIFTFITDIDDVGIVYYLDERTDQIAEGSNG